MKRQILIFLILLIPLAGFCPEAHAEQKERMEFNAKKHIFLKSIYEKEFSIELFKEALIYAGITEPQIAFKQAVLETGNFTSELFLIGNNCFGLRQAKSRPTPSIGEFDSHATYWHFYDSIRDYGMLQEWYINRGFNPNDYYGFLQEIGYATDPLYINKLKNLDIV